MTFGAVFLLALGLAMDATAVSAARGFMAPRIEVRHVFLVAFFFGGFQALMPLVGWAVGSHIGPDVQAWDHWIAFALLGGIGGKMLWEARSTGGDELLEARDLFGLRVMLLLAIATSIDAFAAGITLPMLHAPFLSSIAIIGVTTATLSAGGLFIGRRFGAALGRRLDALGGAVLIALGTRILFSHLFMG